MTILRLRDIWPVADPKSSLQLSHYYLSAARLGRVPVSELPNVLADHFEAMKIADTIS